MSLGMDFEFRLVELCGFKAMPVYIDVIGKPALSSVTPVFKKKK